MSHNDNSCGKVQHNLHVMTDHKNCTALLAQRFDHIHDLHTLFVIQTRSWLIEHKNIWLTGNHRCKRNHLTLSARKHKRRRVRIKSHAINYFKRFLASILCRHSLELKTKRNLLKNTLFANLVIGILEQRRDVLSNLRRLPIPTRCALKVNVSRSRTQQTIYQLS